MSDKREPLELRGGGDYIGVKEWNAAIDNMETKLEAHYEGESDRPLVVAAKVARVAAYTVAGVVVWGLVTYVLVMIGLFLSE